MSRHVLGMLPFRGARSTCAVLLFLLLAFAFAGAPGSGLAGADASAPPLDAKARATRRSELRSAVTTWAGHRLRFPSRCPMCKGTGLVPTGMRAGPRFRVCTQCKGRKAWISPPHYRAAYYELRSPAFQKLPGIQDTLETQYKEANQGKPWPTVYDRYRIRDVELVDDTHGIARILYDAQAVGTATYWIWSTDAQKKGAWYLYDSRSDGPWPGPSGGGGAGGGGGEWADLPAAELASLRTAAAGSTTTFWAVEFLARGDVLRVILEPRATTRSDVDHADLIAGDALALFAPLFAVAGSRSRIETEWRTWWRNVDGTARLKPTWTVSLDRAAFEGRGWKGLPPAEQMALLLWSAAANPGWQRVLPQGSTSTPAPPPPTPEPPTPAPEPPPSTPQPEEPGPATPPPAPPSPTPPAPAPTPTPPPPPPPPAPVAKGPPPQMTPEAKKKGEAGVAKMRELFTAVKVVYDEAQQAREASTDVYQEKLEEVRARLGEIEEVWQSEVVPAMPGRDDAERDELANEHFGGVWTEIDALKSIVRKLSRIG